MARAPKPSRRLVEDASGRIYGVPTGRTIANVIVKPTPTGGCFLFVLADDGTLWQYHYDTKSWFRYPALPTVEEQA